MKHRIHILCWVIGALLAPSCNRGRAVDHQSTDATHRTALRPTASDGSGAGLRLNEPGGDLESSEMALTNPDEYAWQLFFFISQQAEAGKAGVPDLLKTGLNDYDDDRDVVWETWALSSGTAAHPSEVFKGDGSNPGAWDDLPRHGAAKQLYPGFNGDHKIVADQNQESRMNRSTFETVVSQGLYSVANLTTKAKQATGAGMPSMVMFPQASKEIKAFWIRLPDCVSAGQACDVAKKRYHWRTVGNQVWGLVSLHITTKDLSNWVWIDFGHVDCDYAEPSTLAVKSQCPKAVFNNGPSPLDSTTVNTNGVRPETVAKKWQNYRLRGTETVFVGRNGKPVLLWNPVIERGRSSCITCHFYASIPDDPALETNFTPGAPDCSLMYEKGAGATKCPSPGAGPDPAFKKLTQVQTDFVWAIPSHAK